MLEILTQTATIVVKPEAIVARQPSTVLEYLEQPDYSTVAALPFKFNRQVALSLWQYQWNKATVDRVKLHVYMLESCPSLLIVLQDCRPHRNIPASVRLWSLEGASIETRREPHHLRSVLGMNNRMIGFVHTADEPADILREQGLFFDGNLREKLWQDVAANFDRKNTFNTLNIGQELESTTTHHSVSLNEVVEQLKNKSRPEIDTL